MTVRGRLLLWLGLCCWFCGCDKADRPDRFTKVRGTVTYLNRALPTGSIVFIPDETRGFAGPMARAEIQQDGSYSLRTGDRPGVAPGKYRVTVRAVAAVVGRPGQTYLLAPERYSDPGQSGLACEV